MLIAPLKTIGLAFLLLVPSSTPPRAAEAPPRDEEVTIAEDGDFNFDFDFGFDDDDEPLILSHRIRLGGGYVGLRLLGMTPELRAHFGAPRDAGILVSAVEPESPAARGGLQVGDIITQAGAERIDSIGDLYREVRGKKAGETLDFEISRGRSTKRLTVTVEERERSGIGPRAHRDHRRFRIRDLDSMGPLLDRAQDLSRLEERLEEMEKRMKELEKKLGTR